MTSLNAQGVEKGDLVSGRSLLSDPDTRESIALRTDLDRALTRTMAYLYPLLLLQSIPSFLAQRAPHSPLAPVSLLLAALPCGLVILALRHRRAPSRLLLLVGASVYIPVAALEAVETRTQLPEAYLPWLLVVAPIFIPSLALGARTVRGWMSGAALGIGVAVVAYAPRMSTGRVLMTVFSLTVFCAGASAGIHALRRRADRADAARRAASARYDATQRRIALEEERARTDALIHDSLLNALLAAPAASSANSSMARSDALRSVNDAVALLRGSTSNGGRAEKAGAPSRAIDSIERELRPLRGTIELSIIDRHEVRLAPLVLDALTSATLQAVNNSLKHAGSGARRAVRVESTSRVGLRIIVSDDGTGFDPEGVGAERLGLRISILKRMRSVGGSAEIRTAPGAGTRITLNWPTALDPPALDLLVASAARA